MADDFPEDSFFRNSNVAALDAVVQEREEDVPNKTHCNNKVISNIKSLEEAPETLKFMTAKELLNTRQTATAPSEHEDSLNSSLSFESLEDSAIQALSNKSTKSSKSSVIKKKASKAKTSKTGKKNEKSMHCEEVSNRGATSNSQNSETSSKDKSKSSYRPLNITRSMVLQVKQSSTLSADTSTEPTDFSCISDGTLKDDSSMLSTQQRLKLDTWGLPQSILKQYAKRGVTEMFPWQVECLCCPRVLNGGNLVYSAPTSAGKTLVSEIICIKTVLERRKKVIFVLPFVSVVREKMFYFQEIFQGTKVRVNGYMGGHSAAGGFKSLDLAICTIEKANSLINRLMEENELEKLGAIVVDELHLIGDSHRGYLLELLLTKLKYMSLRNNEINIQIIGMSATLPNLSLLSRWLDADLYKTSFRPVPLAEYIKIGNSLYDNKLKLVRKIEPELVIKNDTEDIVYLCLETIANGHSVLIFCSTKSWCESLAQTVASEFRTIGLGRDVNAPDSLAYKLREQLNSNKIAESLEQLRNCPVGLDSFLGKVMSFGVAYHHAGLSMDERDIVEGCFKNGTLRVLIATTTLSSGVNLPARRVIIRSPTFQGRSIDILSYRQMIGRAGRMGVDTAGESIVICQSTEQRIVTNLVCSSLKPIESCLGHGDLSASLKRAILEVIASRVASTPEDLELYTKCTLLSSSREGTENTSNPVSSCISFLKDNELIRLQTAEDGILRYSPTPLGQACLSASIHPDEGLRLFQELQRARQCFVLENELHLVYQVTPFNVADQWGNIDWMHVLALWEQLSPDMKRVGELVGVEDRFIVRAMRGTINLKLEKQRQKMMIHRRFYTALALHDLVNEVPLNSVATKFNCSRGMLQSLQQSASTYAGMVTSFSHRLGWSSVELLVEQFQDRLHFGTHRELLDLLRVPSLNGPRARALHNAGITCLSELTTADVLAVENALLTAIPFSSEKEKDGETTSELKQRQRLKGIWVTGRQGLSEREAAELLIKEARLIVQAELGLAEVNWDQKKQENSAGDNVTSSQGGHADGSVSSPSNESTSKTNQSKKNMTEDAKLSTDDVRGNIGAETPRNDSGHAEEKRDKTEALPLGDHSAHVQEMQKAPELNSSIHSNVPVENTSNDYIFIDGKHPNDSLANDTGKAEEKTEAQLLNGCMNTNVPITNGSINAHILAKNNSKDFTFVIDAKDPNDTIQEESGEKSSQLVIESSALVQKNTVNMEVTNNTVHKLDEALENSFNSSRSMSADLLDNNICDTSNLSEGLEITSSLPNSKTLIPSANQSRSKVLQNSLDDLFESSFSNSAFVKLADHAAEPLNTVNDVPQQDFKVVPPPIQQSGAYSCLESWGISDSALDRLCVQEENDVKSPQTKIANISEEKLSLSKRLSSDMFSPNQSQRANVTITNEFGVKESEDLFGSFVTPTSDRILRSRNGSGSGIQDKHRDSGGVSALHQSNENAQSPSLFGDSFEINSGLMEMLDGNENSKPVSVLHEKPPSGPMITSLKCESNQVGMVHPPTDADRSPFPSNNKRKSVWGKLLKPCKEVQCSDETGEKESIGKPKQDNVLTRSKNTGKNLGLSRRGLGKRSAPKDDIKSVIKSVQENANSEVLTDSFLEAAFHAAFDSDSAIIEDTSPKVKEVFVENGTNCSEKENVLEACNVKRLKVSESSDEEIVNSPQDNVKSKTERKLKSHISSDVANEEHEESEKCKLPVQRGSVIGPPLTRRMLAVRQKSNLEADQNQFEGNTVHSFTVGGIKDSSKNPFDSTLVEDWSIFNIIDVCRSSVLFKTFAKEVLNTMVWSVSLACEQSETTESSGVIGSKVLKTQRSSKREPKTQSNCQFTFGRSVLVGVSFCFGSTDAYFLSLESNSEQCVVSLTDRIQLLRNILCLKEDKRIPTVCCFDVKEQFKMLSRCMGIQMHGLSLCDPKIGDWLLEPEGKEKTFQAMVLKYAEQALGLAEYAGQVRQGFGSPAMDADQTFSGRQRSSVEAILSYQIMSTQFTKLLEAGLAASFLDVEMPVVACVAGMELVGIGFNSETLQTLQEKLREEMSALEKRAYHLAGRSFSLTSPADTARVLYQELKLGQTQSMRGRQKNTSKETLTKLRSEHPLPNVILLWRKLSAIHSKTVCPLLPTEPCTRMFGSYILHTATGRISMHEPNIQCIPRDFEISPESSEAFCMRAAFTASAGNVLVAADYSQLELRLLAELSGEPKLKDILNCGQDVFCNLAASWNSISPEQVTDDLRQKAKQLCYGIIYGMGSRALADQLAVEETEATSLMESFHSAFPGINHFLSRTVNQCREQGYVKTLLGRRRYLPGIKSSNIHVKAHAERQAVNTTVQGSAADLTKNAMIAVEKGIEKAFPEALRDFSLKAPRLVLNLHDELMYEVPHQQIDQFCKLLKHGMETSIALSVKLPVKIKVGMSWGNLEPKLVD